MRPTLVLPAPPDRVESGTLQFGDDWPGVFIRGDNAAYYAMLLRSVLTSAGGTPLERLTLAPLYKLLSGCVIGGAAEMLPPLPEISADTNFHPDRVALKVLRQGDVRLASTTGYDLKRGADVACFFLDIDGGRAEIESSTGSDNGCPVVHIGRDGAEACTEIEFPEFVGWRFHAGGDGKSLAIALIRNEP